MPNRLSLPESTWEEPAAREILHNRDFQGLFRLAQRHGISQGRIASASGITQSEVSRIVNPSAAKVQRQISNIHLIERIADGFDLPDDARVLLGLAPKNAGIGDAPRPLSTDECYSPVADTIRVAGPPALASKLHSPKLHNVLALAQPSTVSPAVLGALESSIVDFWRRDDQYGGEPLRPAVTAQLRYVLELLDECRSENRRQRLQAIAAELARLTGWILFDAQQFNTGRTYFEEALRLARDLDDYPFIANVLASMSLQATYEEQPSDALALTRAAQDACRLSATPRIKSMLAMREAFAHATLADASACHGAISEAQRNLETVNVEDDDPKWITYFGETKLIADAGIALSQLGDTHGARPLIEQALEQQDSANARTRAFHSFWLATTQLHAGDLDEACATALDALELASSVASARIIAHLADFRNKLVSHRAEPAARELQGRIGDFLRESLS